MSSRVTSLSSIKLNVASIPDNAPALDEEIEEKMRHELQHSDGDLSGERIEQLFVEQNCLVDAVLFLELLNSAWRHDAFSLYHTRRAATRACHDERSPRNFQ